MVIAASFCVTAVPMHRVTLERAAASVLQVTKDSAVIEVQRSSCIMLHINMFGVGFWVFETFFHLATFFLLLVSYSLFLTKYSNNIYIVKYY